MMSELQDNPGSFGYMPSTRTSYNSPLRSDKDVDDLMYLDSPVQEVYISISTDSESDYSTSIDALRSSDGVASKIDRSKFPINALYDFGGKEIFTSDGSGSQPPSDIAPIEEVVAWPMFTITFLMVPKHLENLVPDATERGLLYAFLESFYNRDYISICREKYNYAYLPSDATSFAIEGINLVRNEPTNSYSGKQPVWIFENNISTVDQATDLLNTPYLLSAKRNSYTETIVDDINSRVNELTTTVEDTQMGLAIIEEELMNMKLHVNKKKNTINEEDNYEDPITGFNDDDMMALEAIEDAISAALVLSSLSFTAWMIVGCYFIGRCLFRCYRGKSRAAEQHHQNNFTANNITNLHDLGAEPDGIFSQTGTVSTNGSPNSKKYEEAFFQNNSLELSSSVTSKTTNGNKNQDNGIDKADSTDDVEFGVSARSPKKAVL
jgi:hypothetical protein